MAKKIISVEIGTSLTHVVEMSAQAKQHKIYHCFSFETPKNMMQDGKVVSMEDFLPLFNQEMNRLRIATKEVIFVISSNRVANRTVSIPLVKENRIGAIVEANASEYFPVDISQYQLGYQILDKKEETENKEIQLGVFAVPKDIIESYKLLAETLKLKLIAIDHSGNSILQGMKVDRPNEACAVYIRVDEYATTITIMEHGTLALQRTLAYGIGEAISLVKLKLNKEKKLQLRDVYQFLSENKIIHPEMFKQYSLPEDITNDSEGSGAALVFVQEVTGSTTVLVENLVRVLDYYIARTEENNLSEIVLTGTGAAITGFDQLLTQELGYPVTPLVELAHGGVVTEPLKEKELIAEYVGCIGAIISPIHTGFGDKQKNQDTNKEGISLRIPLIVSGACVVAAFLLIIGAILSSASLDREKAQIEQEMNNLADAQTVFDQYQKMQIEYENATALEGVTKTATDAILEVFVQMEEKFPQGTFLESISSTTEGISVNAKTTSMDACAITITNLRTIEQLSNVSISQVTEETDESGNAVISFTVSMNYVLEPQLQEQVAE